MGNIPEILTFTAPTQAIIRDRWGRPLIEPIGGGKAIPYTRVSTLAKALDDKTGLTKWMQRMVLEGVSSRPDLAALASAAKGDAKQLGKIVELAMAAAESDRAANLGTAIHSFTERIDAGDRLYSDAPLGGHSTPARWRRRRGSPRASCCQSPVAGPATREKVWPPFSGSIGLCVNAGRCGVLGGGVVG